MTIAEMVECVEERSHEFECICDNDTDDICMSCTIECVLEDTGAMLEEVVEQLERLE